MQIGVELNKSVENKRIFVIDDDEITRAALQFMLHDENETHEFGDVDAALIKARDWRPDLVILGMGIVRELGMDIVAVIKDALPATKLLLVTEDAKETLTQQALAAGAHGALAKPLTVETVRRKTDTALGRHSSFVIPIHKA